jgi:quercetin dioxygenase-like cupin family protein
MPSSCTQSVKGYLVARKGNEEIFVGPEEGARLPVLDVAHKVPSESLGRAATIVEWGLPPGVMIPPHTHSREHECSYVLKGELTCDVGGEIVVAPVGSYVVKPRGVYHALCNAGTEPVWVIELHAPGGFEGWYDEYEEIASKLASGEMDEEKHRRARAELSERYGVSFHDERIPEAMARFGIGS